MTFSRCSAFVLTAASLAAACGGATPTASTASTGPADTYAWETALVPNASFALASLDEDVAAIRVTITSVEQVDGARTYRLAWDGNDAGPTTLVVRGAQVTIGDATVGSMARGDATAAGDELCFAEDFSNPDGCDDVCDADLCFTSAGVSGVSGQYAPDQGRWGAVSE